MAAGPHSVVNVGMSRRGHFFCIDCGKPVRFSDKGKATHTRY